MGLNDLGWDSTSSNTSSVQPLHTGGPNASGDASDAAAEVFNPLRPPSPLLSHSLHDTESLVSKSTHSHNVHDVQQPGNPLVAPVLPSVSGHQQAQHLGPPLPPRAVSEPLQGAVAAAHPQAFLKDKQRQTSVWQLGQKVSVWHIA